MTFSCNNWFFIKIFVQKRLTIKIKAFILLSI
jgi:hypothetical protein